MSDFKNDMQSRKWLLTINNPQSCDLDQEKIIDILHLFHPMDFCMADEIASTGTYHTHIFLYSHSPMRFQTVKNRFPTAHINKPAGTVMDNRNYIRKEGKWTETAKAETRVEGTFVEFGTPPTKGEENSSKMHQLLRNVKEGLSTTEIVEENPSFCLQTQKIDQLRDNLKNEPFSKQFRELEVHYLFGASGAGKTRSIFRKHEIQDICRITDYGGRNGVRFDGYHTQPVLVFEEFHSQIPIESMLIFLDTYPTTLPARYQYKVVCYTTVYITSNIPLEAQYPEIQQYDSETWRAFLRRIHTVTQFFADGTTEVLYDEMVTDGSLRIALTNAAGETPTLLRERRDRENRRMKIWELNNPGIPLKMWLDKQLEIEAAFDLHVIDVDYGKSTSRIILKFVPGRNTLPNYIEWKDEYLSPDSFVLTLGEGYIGPIAVDLAMIPHILLGGSTGSGKSVLLKLLLMQSLRKGAKIYIADFKGGVDFPSEWHRQCRMCFEEHDLLELLTGIAEELQRRKQLFNSAACSNLDEYNKTAKIPLKRCVFACDEVAELLDKTGLSAEQRKLIGQIESKLAMIARQGRAFGIHLILATQRPDANLIPGQIRTNLGCRICGRADSILSQIILDSTAAADEISKEARGRFLLHDGTVFQGYWFDENMIERRGVHGC